jgi:hypothetical protein
MHIVAPSRRRTAEPTPPWAACKWLNKCHGADLIRADWLELDLWSPLLSQALRLPKFGRRYPCEGCPIVASREAAA